MKISFILVGIVFIACALPRQAIRQENNFKDAKSLGESVLKCYLSNDSTELAKIIDRKFLLSAMDESLSGNKKDSIRKDSLLRAKFDHLLKNIFFDPLSNMHKQLIMEGISNGKLDTIKVGKALLNPKVPNTAQYTLRLYFISSGKKFAFDIDVIEERNVWYLAELEDYLTGPYGFEQTIRGNRIIEEHKIGGDTIIINH